MFNKEYIEYLGAVRNIAKGIFGEGSYHVTEIDQ